VFDGDGFDDVAGERRTDLGRRGRDGFGLVGPYANDKGRMAYSFRATAIVAPKGGKAAAAPASSSGKAVA
jgi:hypothetical protein